MKNKILKQIAIFAVAFGLGGVAYASSGVVAPQYKWMTLAVFGAIIAATMFVTYLAARSTHSTSEFYAAGRSVSGIQNGWAIAGDYLSAASFLGIAGLISLYGYDGFMYSVGWLVAYITVLLVIAEPCRNIGKYTMGDILAFRNDPKKTKTVAAISTIVVSTFYMTAQMVGGGVLIKTLIGIDYEISVAGVGVLMLAYVVFGGMKATTWVQIIKAVLLVTASLVLVTLVWAPYGFSLPGYLQNVVNNPEVQQQVARLLGDQANTMTLTELGQRFLEPGLFLKNPIDQISLGIALVFGTAGMPHILMRFFTVPTAQAARTSVIWAMAIIGGFYVLTLFLGTGAATLVGASYITAIDPGGNMAAPLLAQYLGGGENSIMGNFFLAFVAAVAFATIVAVVAGLVLASASAMAHDIYVGVIRGDNATPQEQVMAARISSLIVGIMAIGVGILAKGQNVAHLVALAFAVAASSNLPCVFLTLYWKRCNTWGIVCGMIGGSFMAIALVLVSPNMTYPKLVLASANKVLAGAPAHDGKPAVPGAAEKVAALKGKLDAAKDAAEKKSITLELMRAQRTHDKAVADIKKFEGQTTSIVGLEKPLISLKNPGLISVPFGFLMVLIFSLMTRDKRSEEMWEELYVRQNTGINAEKATVH
ncbi:MAG: cation acetate symporter [Oxalobacter sp.]|nr:MAG: cation acetate symporter [Oxalobacter sp.]